MAEAKGLYAPSVEKVLSHGRNRQSTGNVNMLLKMSLNVMSARKNSGQQVITRNTFFFTKKKRRNWYVMNVGRGLAIPPSLTTTHKSIHLKKYINAQIGGVAKHSNVVQPSNTISKAQ